MTASNRSDLSGIYVCAFSKRFNSLIFSGPFFIFSPAV